MARLIAKSAAAGLLPIEIGTVTLTEETPAAITALMPFAGQLRALSAAFKAAHGVPFPGPNRSSAKGGTRVCWSGLDEAFLIGDPAQADLADHAAVVDQTDAWAVLHLEGKDAAEVLARLTPINLGREHFKRGHAARSLIGHMTALIIRTGAQGFTILIFRSMAATAIHELDVAMRGVAARAALQSSP
ncbi:MAG: sarcosine oxidase subunit gamma [Roseicyclus sp.]|nr:sarcosine oxidase subunit gamma [Roseicyclus sp.]MBO6624749.1 sarcosine oxidase subunit gamma [Roseicyclus sp.]MBO6921469.1 sarcosine oxidase subunit gamma [Roseicyclus sp.]